MVSPVIQGGESEEKFLACVLINYIYTATLTEFSKILKKINFHRAVFISVMEKRGGNIIALYFPGWDLQKKKKNNRHSLTYFKIMICNLDH